MQDHQSDASRVAEALDNASARERKSIETRIRWLREKIEAAQSLLAGLSDEENRLALEDVVAQAEDVAARPGTPQQLEAMKADLTAAMSDARKNENRYLRIMTRIFHNHYQPGATKVEFERHEMEEIASRLSIKLPKNLGDVVYSFRYRSSLPESIQDRAPAGKSWIILPAGIGKYKFTATDLATITPRAGMVTIKVPDATPGIIMKHALGDEQALLAKVRYNRLVDLFLGIVCFSLQNHLRTTVPDVGQVETDEVYVGVDKQGAQYVVPAQAKRGKDKLSIVQIWQDVWMCANKFGSLLCRPVAAIQMDDGAIAIILFAHEGDELKIAAERHYRLVQSNDLSPSELQAYNSQLNM